MTLTFPFSMYEKVCITPLGIDGVITKIILNGDNVWYSVEYWWEGVAKCVDVCDNELKSKGKICKPRTLGDLTG